MNDEKESVAFDYIKYYNEACIKYGKDKTIIFMQVGSFYESYFTNSEGPDLVKISKITGVSRSLRYKTRDVSMTNPYILGFPMVSLIKFSEMLMDEDFVIVVIDQILGAKGNNKKEQRKITNVYSKSTYIENIDKREGNYLVCVYLCNEKQSKNDSLLSVGLSASDVSTGHVFIHEA